MKFVKALARLFYRFCLLFPQRDAIVLLSRQSHRPFNYTLLEPELRKQFPDYTITWLCISKLGRYNVVLTARSLYHVARCRIAITDGYSPAISFPNGMHRAFIVQVWHALGAIKKFGYTSMDTPAGWSSEMSVVMSMHQGYDYIIAGVPGAAESFARSFGYPLERIAPLGSPHLDYLTLPEYEPMRRERYSKAVELLGFDPATSGKTVVLYAPTFRRGKTSVSTAGVSWVWEAVDTFESVLPRDRFELLVSCHPLDVEKMRGEAARRAADPDHFAHIFTGDVNTDDLLFGVDLVITDYSTISFDNYYLGQRTLFYLPDHADYSASPGLFIDPLVHWPSECYSDAGELARAIVRAYDDPCVGSSQFDTFMDGHFAGLKPYCTEQIVTFIREHASMGEYSADASRKED